MSQDRIEFSCSNCGSKNFIVPSNPASDDMVICGSCGEQEKYGVIRKSAIELTKKAITEEFMNIFK